MLNQPQHAGIVGEALDLTFSIPPHLKHCVVCEHPPWNQMSCMKISFADDHSRVTLSAATNVSGSDYINASTIVSIAVLLVSLTDVTLTSIWQ